MPISVPHTSRHTSRHISLQRWSLVIDCTFSSVLASAFALAFVITFVIGSAAWIVPMRLAAQAPAKLISVRAVGDVLLGSYTPQRFIPPDSGKGFVQTLRPFVSGADIVFGNFEAAFARENDPTMRPQKCAEASRQKGVCFEFGTPPHLAPVLKQLGFTVMSVDNNHADDYGDAAATFTKTTLQEQGIQPAPKRGFAALTVQGKRVAVIAFGFSNTSYNLADLQAARTLVAALKTKSANATANAPAFDLVIVSFHGGAEGKNATHVQPNSSKPEMFYGENRGNVVAFARACVDAGADMVIGHGPHVLRALELYRNKLIAYSLGNFLTYGNINVKGVSGVTCVLDVGLNAETGNFTAGRIIPIVQRDPGVPEYDRERQAITLLQSLMQSDFPQGALTLDAQGLLLARKK
jgi:poly-gamma-glutamate capsule biosynthesis protein CapA/YwtB (metallophosphatase superfamily)